MMFILATYLTVLHRRLSLLAKIFSSNTLFLTKKSIKYMIYDIFFLFLNNSFQSTLCRYNNTLIVNGTFISNGAIMCPWVSNHFNTPGFVSIDVSIFNNEFFGSVNVNLLKEISMAYIYPTIYYTPHTLQQQYVSLCLYFYFLIEKTCQYVNF